MTSTRHVRSFSRRFARLSFLTGSLICTSALADIDASWLGPVSGNWTDPTKWSTDPIYPNNGTPSGSLYDAIITAGNSAFPGYPVMINPGDDVTVNSLRLGISRLIQDGGSVTIGTTNATSAGLQIGDGAKYELDQGVLTLGKADIHYIGINGTGTLEQNRGIVNLRSFLAVGIGGGSLASGTGLLHIENSQSQWLAEQNGDTDIGVGIGPLGNGTFSMADNGTVSLTNLAIGSSLGHGTLIIGSHLTANRLTIGNGPWDVGGSGTIGFGTAILNSSSSTVTLGNPTEIGFLSVGGHGTFAVSAGTIQADITFVSNGGLLNVSGGVANLGFTQQISGEVLLSSSGHILSSGGIFKIFDAGHMDVSGGWFTASQVSMTSGTPSLAATGGLFTIGSFTQSTGTSTFSGTAALNAQSITLGGNGSMHFGGDHVEVTTMSITGGAADFSAGTMRASDLHVSGGHFTLAGGAGLRLDVNSVEVEGPGVIDLNDDRLVINYVGASPVGQIRDDIARAYDDGAWTGPGITSSLADATHGVGYADLAGTTVVARLTRYGDANLDQTVNLIDFNTLVANFGIAGSAIWSQGDFNYDGVVNLLDFNRLAANFGLAATGPEVTPADWAILATAVPEPGLGFALIAVGTMNLTLRRRRHIRLCGRS